MVLVRSVAECSGSLFFFIDFLFVLFLLVVWCEFCLGGGGGGYFVFQRLLCVFSTGTDRQKVNWHDHLFVASVSLLFLFFFLVQDMKKYVCRGFFSLKTLPYDHFLFFFFLLFYFVCVYIYVAVSSYLCMYLLHSV